MRYLTINKIFLILLISIGCNGGSDKNEGYLNKTETLEKVYFSQADQIERLYGEIENSIRSNGMLSDEVIYLEMLSAIRENRISPSIPFKAGLESDKFVFSQNIIVLNEYQSYLKNVSIELRISNEIDSCFERTSYYLNNVQEEFTYEEYLLMSLNLFEAERMILQNIKLVIRAFS